MLVRTFFAFFVFATALVGIANFCCAKTQWTLKNGVKFEGEEISKTENTVSIRLPYGKLELNNSEIESVKIIDSAFQNNDAQNQKSAASVPAITPQTAKFRAIGTTNMTRVIMPQRNLKKANEKNTFDTVAPTFLDDAEFISDYKNFIRENFPEGWLAKFKIGYADVTTNSDRSGLDLGLTVEKTWDDIHDVFLYGFYNYAREHFPATGFTNISVDRYGAGGEYSYSFLGESSGIFAITAMDYKTDTVKYIDVLTDNMVGIGYEFKFLEEYGIDFDVSVGPGVRYSQYSAPSPWGNYDIEGNDTYFMGYIRQNMTWRIAKNLKIEQKMIFALDLEHMDSWENVSSEYYEKSFYISVALVYSPTDVFSFTLRYSYDFDAENNLFKSLKNSYSSDSRFIIGVEIPIGYRK